MDKQLNITLGSLFDGIGGFPYAASFFGIETLWGSEIMPQAISVTQRHLPGMEHAGDITALRGDRLPPVDIITFGSPCQDLSVAGRRAGLGGERSGLFAEAIRIIDEMRHATHGRYPRYALWENVPGALSSGNPRGSDFRAVLEAFTKTEIPVPRSGHWANAGMVRGDGIDLAWCVYNAQYFGVPQRRRRIFLVCDFGGRSAAEILFIPKSLSGYFAARRAQGQNPAADAARCADGASLSANVKDTAATITAGYGKHWDGNAGAYDGGNFALSPDNHGTISQMAFACNQRDEVRDLHDVSAALCAHPTVKQQTFIVKNCLNPWDTQQSRVFTEDGMSPTLAGADGGGGRNPGGLVCAPYMCESDSCIVINDQGGDSLNVEKAEISPTLRGETHGNQPIVAVDAAHKQHPAAMMIHPDVCGTLVASGSGLSRPGGMASETDLCVAYCLQGNMIGRQDHNGPGGSGVKEELAFTLTTGGVGGVAATYQDVVGALCNGDSKGIGSQYVSQNKCIVTKYLVRRLTPTECERLQGYPDGWTKLGNDGKEISDTRRYQMLGNSVAVPCVAYIMLGIAGQLGKEASG